MAARWASQALAGVDIDRGGQVGEEPADDPHVFGTDGPRGGHIGQHRRQRFAGQCGAWPQIVGFIEAAAGLAAADA